MNTQVCLLIEIGDEVMDDEKRWVESQMTVLWVLAVWLKLGLLQVEAGSCWSRGKWEYLEVSISRLVQRESGQVQVVNGRPDDDCLSEATMSADKWLQVRVINNQVTGSGCTLGLVTVVTDSVESLTLPPPPGAAPNVLERQRGLPWPLGAGRSG